MTDPIASIGAASPATPAAKPDDAKLRKAAQGFEAVFARQMISSMRTASLGDGILDSDATQQFRDMSDGKLADALAQKGSLGIADMLVKQWGARVAGSAGKTDPGTAR